GSMKNNFSSIILMRSANNSMPSRQKAQARICMISARSYLKSDDRDTTMPVSASDTIGRMVLRFTQTPNRGTAEPQNRSMHTIDPDLVLEGTGPYSSHCAMGNLLYRF